MDTRRLADSELAVQSRAECERRIRGQSADAAVAVENLRQSAPQSRPACARSVACPGLDGAHACNLLDDRHRRHGCTVPIARFRCAPRAGGFGHSPSPPFACNRSSGVPTFRTNRLRAGLLAFRGFFFAGRNSPHHRADAHHEAQAPAMDAHGRPRPSQPRRYRFLIPLDVAGSRYRDGRGTCDCLSQTLRILGGCTAARAMEHRAGVRMVAQQTARP